MNIPQENFDSDFDETFETWGTTIDEFSHKQTEGDWQLMIPEHERMYFAEWHRIIKFVMSNGLRVFNTN